jgi:hypothetical protein
MAGYVRDKLQIIGGGFNMLPPGDKAPKNDYLLAQNWRTDRTGRLITRWGYPLKFSIAGPAYAHSGANSGGDETNYYIAANAAAGANPCSVYFNGSGTALASGLSGYRVGFASMLGWMFIMDRVKQLRHDGTNLHTWGIAAPLTALTPAAGTADPTGPSGTYNFYVTYATSDGFYETGPGPESIAVTVTGNDINFTGIPVSPDAAVGVRNIYAVGGTLGAAYLVLSIANNTATTGTWNTNDLTATDEGITMPVGHMPPPAGEGLAGPYFSRLYTWVGNRLYYTPQGQPQYWNTDSAAGDWVDVGTWGEQIIWVTSHTNVLMIYKEKSIWRLIGDPIGGSLEQLEEGIGLTNAFAIASGAGPIDYFVAPNGLRRCNLDRSEPFGAEVSPLFNSPILNANTPLEMPGSILTGPNYLSNTLDSYAVSVGYAMSKLYVSYSENVATGANAVTLVYDERTQKWSYHRNGLTTTRFWGYYFDGVQFVGLTGNSSGPATAIGASLDDFRGFLTEDSSSTPIECIYQSRYEDAGLPDNQKTWIEVVVDLVLQPTITATVKIGLDNAIGLSTLGTVTGTGVRTSYSFPLGTDGYLAKNISIGIDFTSGATSGLCEIHNVYLYYYAEARLALAASTLPTDLGTATVKQCKELILDIDTSAGGTVGVNLYSDLPGNALAVRHTPTVPVLGGRALYKFPFAVTLGYLWRVALKATGSQPFRLYSVRLLMRPIGTYVEAYESTAGFVWDSMQLTFESGITHIPRSYAIALAALPIKRFREISVEIETFNSDVTLTFLTDLPGNAMAARYTTTINTGTAGRRFVRIPLPLGIGVAPFNPASTYSAGDFVTSAGISWISLQNANTGHTPSTSPTWWQPLPIEGRMCQLQFSGTSSYVIYDIAVELLAVGVYVEAYESTAGAVYDSREVDFGSAKPKEARELELDIETTGAITADIYCDLPGYTMALGFQNSAVSTSGRQKIKLPLTHGTAPFDYPMGRLFRLVITSVNAFRLYGAKLLLREFGCYLTGDEAGANPIGVFDTTPIDLGSERVKEYKKLELEMQTDTGGTATVKVWTDQPAGVMTLQFTTTVTTAGARASVKIPLTNGIRGRLVQVEVSGSGVRLFAGRIWARPLNEPKAQWQWVPLPIPPTPPTWGWAPFSVNPTEAQWFWAKCLSVAETPDTWNAIDVPFEVVGD